jgi:acyl carrier protein
MSSADAETLLRRVGVRPLATHDAIAALDALAASNRPQVIVADIDWHLFKGSYEARGHRRLLERLSVTTPEPSGSYSELAAQLESVAAGDRERLLIDLVQTEVAQVLGLAAASRPDPDQGLFEMGMDSLMALELRTRLETRAARALPATLVFDCPAIATIARFLLAQMAGAPRGAPDTAAAARLAATRPPPQTTGAVRPSLDLSELSDQDAEALLLDRLESLESID